MKGKKKAGEGSADFASLIKQAEEAVANVKDERLREIAFERVLDHLLSGTDDQAGSGHQIKTEVHKSKLTRKESAKPASGTLAWLADLHEEGFFKEPKSLKDILEELSNRSHLLKSTDLTWPLQKLCHDKMLRRRQQVPAEGGHKVFHWYNW